MTVTVSVTVTVPESVCEDGTPVEVSELESVVAIELVESVGVDGSVVVDVVESVVMTIVSDDVEEEVSVVSEVVAESVVSVSVAVDVVGSDESVDVADSVVSVDVDESVVSVGVEESVVSDVVAGVSEDVVVVESVVSGERNELGGLLSFNVVED